MKKTKKVITPLEVIEILRKTNDRVFDVRWAILGDDFRKNLLNSEYQEILRKVKEINVQIKELEHNLKNDMLVKDEIVRIDEGELNR